MDNSASVKVTTSDERHVAGTFLITDSHTSSAHLLRPSALFSCAENLMEMSGAVSQETATLVDTSAQFIDLNYCKNINATAQVISERPEFVTWEVKLFNQSNAEIARIKLSFVRQKSAPELTHSKPEAKAPTAPKNKLDNKRDAIANAACEVIADKGFAAATMREIAAAANMHVPTMYQYVRSKEEVLELVYKTEISRVRENVREALQADLPPMDKLLGIAASFVHGNDKMRKEAGVLNRELRSLAHQARSRVLADYAELMTDVGHVISDGIAAGEIREVEPELVANMIDAICDLWALRPFALSGLKEEDFLQEALSIIKYGLQVKPKS